MIAAGTGFDLHDQAGNPASAISQLMMLETFSPTSVICASDVLVSNSEELLTGMKGSAVACTHHHDGPLSIE